MVEYKRLGKQDFLAFKKLIQLFDVVFENKAPSTANENYLTTLLEKSDFIAFVAIDDNEVLGGLTAYEMPMYYSEQSEVYIYDIAILSEFQKMGIGKKLLGALRNYCNQNGIKEMFVEAHEEDEHAVAFYNSVGGRAESVVHFNFSAIEK